MMELALQTFESEVAKAAVPVLVDFWAPWCGPCRMVSPILEKIEPSYQGKLKFAKLNVDEHQELAAQHDVRGIPCMIIFNKGTEVDRVVGALAEPQLRTKINAILAKI